MSTTTQPPASLPLSALARKQKRLRDWKNLLFDEPQASAIRRSFERDIAAYETLLWTIWDKKGASAEDAEALESLERELEKADELVRLAAAKR